MQIIEYPSAAELSQCLKRPAFDVTKLFGAVQGIIDNVCEHGDAALYELEERFDKVCLKQLAVGEEEFLQAESKVSDELKDAIRLAYGNISRFHEAQRFSPILVTTCRGVVCEQVAVPIERVGLYVPGGSAPLFSTVLMLAVPAQIAGCSEIVLCTPPAKDGSVNPVILFAARLAGVSKVFKVGGSQAIAALAYGTESIPKVDKIFGPGNQYVMAAKQLVSLSDVAIDMPAGPSEVEVLADETANPSFVAADLLSQAEHGADSQVVLISTSREMLKVVQSEVERQLETLPRKEIAAKALSHSLAVLVKDINDAISVTNDYAPEHLVIAVKNYREVAKHIRHAGSVFLGSYSCESAGDYASGTNHTLPTKGYARAYGGLCLDCFVRKMTLQELSPEGVREIGPAVMAMAAGEQLEAHKRAMEIRLDSLKQK